MGGGGGGKGSAPQQAATPQYIDPVTGRQYLTPQELNTQLDKRDEDNRLKSEATAKAAEEKKAKDLTSWQGTFSNAKTAAQQDLERQFTSSGLDPSRYADQIASVINRAASGVQELQPNPAGAFAPSMGKDLINELTSTQQTKNLGTFNSIFDPNYSTSHVTEDIIDPTVTSALASQFDPVNQQLENAQKRGQLSDIGVQGARKAYQDKYTAAKGTASTLAKNILAADRGQVDDYLGKGRTAAGSAPLSVDFDVTPYQTGAQQIIDRERGSFGSELVSALGDSRFVDLQDLMNAGGAAQGPYDPMAGGGAGGVMDPAAVAAEISKKNRSRGLGTQGEY